MKDPARIKRLSRALELSHQVAAARATESRRALTHAQQARDHADAVVAAHASAAPSGSGAQLRAWALTGAARVDSARTHADIAQAAQVTTTQHEQTEHASARRARAVEKMHQRACQERAELDARDQALLIDDAISAAHARRLATR